ncbi:MAG: MFS transporter permease [Desulfobacteraceae bacterium]|jgi:hypothetical protein|nr:MAG: MFS transporter permease [Desulfobacteraceae bacterium]
MTQHADGADKRPDVIVIPKENAVFWLDADGRWRNEDGPFRHKRIIRHFHASISKDENGYFVSQTTDGIIEKVYFHHEDTALFVVRMISENNRPLLVLNTGKQLSLSPENLFVDHDRLYLIDGNDTIKFGERALFAIAEWIDSENGRLYIRVNGDRYEIREKAEKS